jgi:uncharacterized protein involved in exopolysaccharide biosynthesis
MRRLTGADPAVEPPPVPTLEQYTKERSPAPDDILIEEPRPMRTPPRREVASAPPAPVVVAMPTPVLAGPPPPLARLPEPEPEKLIDVQQIADYVGFVGRAILRHKALSFTTFLVTLALTGAGATLWPETWEVEAKLLVQGNEVMSSLVNPTRTIPREAEAPTRAAEEIVLRRDNLIAVIQEVDLMTEWERTRPPLFRLKDRVFEFIRGELTEEEKLDSMVGMLEKGLLVSTSANGVINFDVTWRDRRLAYEIADKAIDNFLQDRRRGETAAITDSISILDKSVHELEAQVNRTIAELPKRPTPRAVRAAPVAPIVPIPTASGPSPELSAKLARVKESLEARRQDFMRLEGQRRQELAQLQARLAAAKTVYTEGHPTVVNLRQSAAALSRESPEEQSVRRAVEALEQEYDSLNATVLASTQSSEEARQAALRAAAARTAYEAPPPDYLGLLGTEASDPTSLRLKVELAQLAAVRERANAARAELSSSQAGFKYQYNVIRPPQLPRNPSGPNIPAILVAGGLGALLLAVFVALSADLTSGLIVEPWQVERQVGVPVAIRMPAL